MTRITLPENAAAIIEHLNINGHEAYAVGGCVRDIIMQREPNDWDITTSARPEQVLELFSEAPFKAIPTGMKHGTITVLYNGEPIEVTTFRIDGEYHDGRHPERVSFTLRLDEDLARRDFTVNAMAYSKSSGVVDMFGGENDIKGRLIRCVGDPYKRFSEDALRILRAVRFAAVLGFELDRDTANAALELSERLELISRERICAELSKLFCGKDAARVIDKYGDIISRVIPISGSSDSIFKLRGESLPIILSAALYGSEPRQTLFDLRFDKKTIERVCTILSNPAVNDYTAAKELCAAVGIDAARDIQKLGYARGELSFEGVGYIDRIISENECITIKQLKINAVDLIELGIEPKRISKALSRLLRAVIGGKIPNERGALSAYALEADSEGVQ